MAAASALYLGLISGTSADGIDVALASFATSPRLHAAATARYPESLRQRILAIAQGDGRIALDDLGKLDVEIGRTFAAAALELLKRQNVAPGAVAALGSHGQTVRHRPGGNAPYTLQLGDPNVIAEATGIVTIADFRRRDMAAGGEGAPLAPAFHAAMLGNDGMTRVVVNLGGIANITVLPGDRNTPILGFDTGPASCLLDAWTERHLGKPFDRDGGLPRPARSMPDSSPRFYVIRISGSRRRRAPAARCSIRRWLQRHLDGSSIVPADVQATLLALTARTVADAIRAHAPGAAEILVCGGGVHNPVLMNALAVELEPVPVRSTSTRGIDPDFVEATLFAWLAHERLLPTGRRCCAR